MEIKDVFMHTVVCTVQGNLFVQRLSIFLKKFNQFELFLVQPVRVTTLMSMYKLMHEKEETMKCRGRERKYNHCSLEEKGGKKSRWKESILDRK